MRIRLANFAVVVSLAVAHGAVRAQDVGVFSEQQAESVLSDDTCPVKLPNGQCARTTDERGWSLGTRAKPKPADTTNIVRPAPRSPATQRSADRGTRVRPVAQPVAAVRPQQLPLQFSAGSYELSPQSRANLANLAKALKAPDNLGKRIRITGHTDKSGTATANRTLSQRRADVAADYIASQGVARSRIDAVGRGFDSLLPGVSPFSPANRRVEVERIQ
jgi:outer membrane protein OmpA-like peptidoglycan-associated protein